MEEVERVPNELSVSMGEQKINLLKKFAESLAEQVFAEAIEMYQRRSGQESGGLIKHSAPTKTAGEFQ